MTAFCECGCGAPTGVYARGPYKGQPKRWLTGHWITSAPLPGSPEQPCQCGCGELAGFYLTTAKGHRKGEPKRFINGHNGVFAGRPFEPLESRYEVADCGYSTPCWVWKRTLSRKGYGGMWDPGKRAVVPAHRYFYERFVGEIPCGLQIDHLCRNRSCVNPNHLEPVTQQVNQQRGANAKLTREQADEIRRRGKQRQRGVRAQLAKEFGVSWPVVDGIVKEHLWN